MQRRQLATKPQHDPVAHMLIIILILNIIIKQVQETQYSPTDAFDHVQILEKHAYPLEMERSSLADSCRYGSSLLDQAAHGTVGGPSEDAFQPYF